MLRVPSSLLRDVAAGPGSSRNYDYAVRTMAALPVATSVKLPGTTDAELAELLPLLSGRVRTLHVYVNGWTAAGFGMMREWLVAHPRCADFGVCGLGSGAAARMREVEATVDALPRLAALTLEGSAFGLAPWRRVAASVGRHPSLQALWVSRNTVGVAGVAVLARELTTNTSLRELTMRAWCQETTGFDDVLDALCVPDRSSAIKRNRTLVNVNFGSAYGAQQPVPDAAWLARARAKIARHPSLISVLFGNTELVPQRQAERNSVRLAAHALILALCTTGEGFEASAVLRRLDGRHRNSDGDHAVKLTIRDFIVELIAACLRP